MKKLILFLVIIMIFCCNLCFAAYNITFQWDANVEPDLAEYRLYTSTISGTYLPAGYIQIPKENTTYIINGLNTTVTTYFVITAVDNYGNESDYSNEAIFIPDDVKPSAPVQFRITIIINQ